MKIVISSEILKLDTKGDASEEITIVIEGEDKDAEDIAAKYCEIVKKLKEDK